MLSVNYNYMNFSVVSDLSDFYKSKLPEMTKIKALVDNIKLLFNLPADRVIVEVAEGERVYKGYSVFLDKCGLDRVFDKIINVI